MINELLRSRFHQRQTFVALLRQIAASKDLRHGRRLHHEILAAGFAHDLLLHNLLIRMYANCGSIHDAKAVFDAVGANGNAFSATAMIIAFVHHGQVLQARDIFDALPQEQASPASWTAMITAYARERNIGEASSLFNKMPQKDLVAWTATLNGLAENERLSEARTLFGRFPLWDSAVWNAMITANAGGGHLDEAMRLFVSLPVKNVISWTAILNAHVGCRYIDCARQIFEKIPARTAVSWTVMVTAFANAGHLAEARDVLLSMENPDVLAYNLLLTAYFRHGLFDETKSCFDSMAERDIVSWNTMLAAYAQFRHLDHVRELFACIPCKNVVSWTTLLVVLSQSGSLSESKQLFDRMPARDLVGWGSVIAVYCQGAQLPGALELFFQMPDHRAVPCWNVIISGHAQSGHAHVGLGLFHEMLLHGLDPNQITLTSVLAACCHTGNSKDVYSFFVSMISDFGILPVYDHFLCMANHLGRSGLVTQAEELLFTMPFEPDAIGWITLLDACVRHKDVKRGERAADAASRLSPTRTAPYTLLCNLYAAVGDSAGVSRVRTTMKELGLVGGHENLDLSSSSLWSSSAAVPQTLFQTLTGSD